jgi:short-subunit dehydrogenase
LVGGVPISLRSETDTRGNNQIWVSVADVSLPDAAAALAAAMKRACRPIDVLVNWVGVPEHGNFSDRPAQRHRESVDLNVNGLTTLLVGAAEGVAQQGFEACIKGEVICVPRAEPRRRHGQPRHATPRRAGCCCVSAGPGCGL